MIPNTLYMMWHSNQLPPKIKENIELVRSINSDMNLELYDENQCIEFISKYYDKDVLVAFNTLIPKAYKCDLWRYCILYEKGGIYSDIKLRPRDNFQYSTFLDKDHLVRDIWESGSGIYNGFMVCPAKYPLLLKSIEQIVKNVKTRYYSQEPHAHLSITGPLLLSNLLGQTENVDLQLQRDYTQYLLTVSVCFKNKPIINTDFPEYREEQSKYTSEPHHSHRYYITKDIYEN